MAKYKVIDELCGDVTFYEDIKEANKEAFNVQGTLIKIQDNGEEIVLRDYSGF